MLKYQVFSGRRAPTEELLDAQRATFDIVIAVTSGAGTHTVDFEPVDLSPSSWVHIRAGQAHQWAPTGYEADLVLLPGIDLGPRWQPGPHLLEFSPAERDAIQQIFSVAEAHHPGNSNARTLSAISELLRSELRLEETAEPDADPIYTDFRRLLAGDPLVIENVGFYAKVLGCSTRTLARACAKSGAPSPKQLINDALLLRAKRFLALPHMTVQATSEVLGFREATNFTKFFKRVSGQTPTDWLASAAS